MFDANYLSEIIALYKKKREIDEQLGVICSDIRKCQNSRNQRGCFVCNTKECRTFKAYSSVYAKLHEAGYEISNKVERKLPSIIAAMGATDKQKIENLIWFCKEELKEFGTITLSTRVACKEAGVNNAEIERIEKQFKR